MRFDVTVLLKAFVHLAHRVVVDFDVSGQATHSGKLIAGQVVAGSDEVREAIFQLQPNVVKLSL